ncbi:MAG: haloacid dehalogenase-like hydrolase [Firmicutes bacterium]|nr:haloacid dehalogenase-like hydrolase [Bacillota bacterium]
MERNYTRKSKSEKPVLAICYDFDKTLTPTDMQAQGYIQSLQHDVVSFWEESNKLARDNDMDQNLAYMYLMKEKARGKLLFTKRTLEEYGEKVVLYPGVDGWFERIKEYGRNHNVIVEHYIISSGLKEMIEATSIAKKGAFEKVYASSFFYNEHGEAQWPAQVVNYTNKTQFLFRIEKGVLDVNDNSVNEYFEPEDIRVPFRNMIYIGDSDTDVPCMKVVDSYGGYSIGVYDEITKNKAKVHKMMKDGRIKYYAESDYTEGSELDLLVKAIIDRTATNEILESKHCNNKKMMTAAESQQDEDTKEKAALLVSLENSSSFAKTHEVINSLRFCKDWSEENKESLYGIALKNSQVRYILTDKDVKLFYLSLLEKEEVLSENAKKVKVLLEKKQKK